MARLFTKDPQAALDYAVDWTDWLGDDAITASTWDVEDGVTVDDDTNTSQVAVVWLSGGTVDATYRATNHITTTAGREDERTLLIRIKQR